MTSLASRILVALAALALAFGAGWFTCSRFELASDASAAKQETAAVIQQSSEVRTQERTVQKDVNNEDKALQARLSAVTGERDAAVERLRKYKSERAAASGDVPSPAGDPGQCDGPPASRLRTEDGEAALRIAAEADAVVEQLRAAQAILGRLSDDDNSGGPGK